MFVQCSVWRLAIALFIHTSIVLHEWCRRKPLYASWENAKSYTKINRILTINIKIKETVYCKDVYSNY